MRPADWVQQADGPAPGGYPEFGALVAGDSGNPASLRPRRAIVRGGRGTRHPQAVGSAAGASAPGEGDFARPSGSD
jgi:hypothetical protein